MFVPSLFHGVKPRSFTLPCVPDGFVFAPERRVPHEVYEDFWKSARALHDQIVFAHEIGDDAFPVTEYVVLTQWGWDEMLKSAPETDELIAAIREYRIGGIYATEQTYVWFKLKFEGVGSLVPAKGEAVPA